MTLLNVLIGYIIAVLALMGIVIIAIVIVSTLWAFYVSVFTEEGRRQSEIDQAKFKAKMAKYKFSWPKSRKERETICHPFDENKP